MRLSTTCTEPLVLLMKDEPAAVYGSQACYLGIAQTTASMGRREQRLCIWLARVIGSEEQSDAAGPMCCPMATAASLGWLQTCACQPHVRIARDMPSSACSSRRVCKQQVGLHQTQSHTACSSGRLAAARIGEAAARVQSLEFSVWRELYLRRHSSSKQELACGRRPR